MLEPGDVAAKNKAVAGFSPDVVHLFAAAVEAAAIKLGQHDAFVSRAGYHFVRNDDGSWQTNASTYVDYQASFLFNAELIHSEDTYAALETAVLADAGLAAIHTFRSYGPHDTEALKKLGLWELFIRLAADVLPARDLGEEWQSKLNVALEKLKSEFQNSSTQRVRIAPLLNVMLPDGPVSIGSYMLPPATNSELDSLASDLHGVDGAMTLQCVYAMIERRIDTPLDQYFKAWPDGWESDLINLLRLVYDGSFVTLSVREFMDSLYGLGDATGWKRLPTPFMLSGDQCVEVRASDSEKINALWKHFLEMPHDSIKVAWHRFSMAYEREASADSLLDQWIALEPLFGDTQSNEVTFKLSLRLAAWLGDTADERRALFTECKKAYGRRSKLAHGKLDAAQLCSEAVRVRGFLKRSLINILERGGAYDTTALEDVMLDSVSFDK